MKILTISDLHGLSTWKSVVPEDYDLIIFMGDYLDSFYHSDKEIMDNFLDVIEFKKAYPDKVVLLIGNHSLHYMFSHKKYGCSGYRASMYHSLHHIFGEEKKLFVPIHVERNEDFTYVWTHAGIHEGWYNDRFLPYVRQNELEKLKLEEQFQYAFDKEAYILFQVGHLRGGYENVGGPFWADRRLVGDKPAKHMHQIVGHSKVKDIQTIDVDFYTSITFTDCLDTIEDKFYELNIY